MTVRAIALCRPVSAPWSAVLGWAWNALLAVAYGRGGRAGGKFLLGSVDHASNPFTQHYCDPDYISGQGGYILGD